MLGALVLTLDNNARRQMGQAHRRICGVDVLATGPGGPEGIDAEILFADIDTVDLFQLRQHRHCAGRGMNPTLRFGFGNALHPVSTGFKFEMAVDILPRHSANQFLITAVFARPL